MYFATMIYCYLFVFKDITTYVSRNSVGKVEKQLEALKLFDS